MRIQTDHLDLKITVPNWTVVIFTGNQSELNEIDTIEDPSGSFNYDLDLSTLPSINADDAIFIDVAVSNLAGSVSSEISENRS